jgi:hypothetical protein
MTEAIDQEIEAIRTVLTALEPLDPTVRTAVLAYVTKRLGITQQTIPGADDEAPPPPADERNSGREPSGHTHISHLVATKQPRNAIQMATLVAYYLSHKAPEGERKQTITTKDIETYFKIADFKLPKSPQYTLPNTKGAGYLDAVGDGEYKLNPVGYNLIVHSMPKTGSKKLSEKKLTKRRKTSPKARKG